MIHPDLAVVDDAQHRLIVVLGHRCVEVRDSRQMDLLVAARAAMLLNHGLQTAADRQSVTDRLLPLILAAAS